MIFSVIATLLIAGMGVTTSTNANAFNFGLESNDVNSGSIDTNSLFSCVGAAITCINSNQDNNNVVANNTAGAPSEPIDPVDPAACAACFESGLSDDQQTLLFAALNVTDMAGACVAIQDLTVDEVLLILANIGVIAEVAAEIVACLEASGAL